MRAAVLVVALLSAFPALAQTERPEARAPSPVLLDATLIVAEPPAPGFRQAPRAPEPGRRRALPLRADFRAAVLSSAGAL